jgi:acetyl esterase/lipase
MLGALLAIAAGVATGADDPLMRQAGTREYRPPKATVETLPNVEIGQGGGRKILAAVFRPRAASDQPRPAVVFIHGGGWNSGQHYNTFGAWLAERGYVVASVGYRLSTEAKWPAQVEDCKLGVRWLRANAREHGVDPDRIGAFGTSAGGHLVCCLGTLDALELEGKGGWEGVSSRVQAAAAFCPVTDLTGAWLKGGPIPDWVAGLFGATREERPGAWKQASPAANVKAGCPPFFIAHGRDDTHVPFSQAERLVAALEEKGNPVEFVPILNAGHGFFLKATTSESVMEPNHEVVMARLLAFFDKHLKPAGSTAVPLPRQP